MYRPILLVATILYLLGTKIVGRFHVVHKLGHGGFATVRLIRRLAHSDNVALEVLRGDAGVGELDILRRVHFPAVTLFLDSFYTLRLNGSHTCSAFDIGGVSP